MKVCLANDSFPPLIDGVSNAVMNYGRVITQKHGSAVVATPKNPGAADNYPFDVVRYTSFSTEKLIGYRVGYPFSACAMRSLEGFAPDIIHSHCPMASNYLSRELRELTGAPLVFTYHTKFDIDINRALKLKFICEPAIREVIRSIEACDEVWAVNRGAGENLRNLGFRGDYLIMPNGVDIDRTPADAAVLEDIICTHSLERDVPVFLFVGRVMWYKGLKIILDGLRQLREEEIRFKMVIVGSGDNLEDVKAYAESSGLGQDCIFTGAIYDRARLKAWYTLADAFLLPSVFDNNPLVVKEAAACGTASILIAGSSSAEGVRDGYNGILISEDAKDMASALRALCADRSLARQMGEHAAEDLYVSWEESIENAVERYGEIIKEHKSGKIIRPKVRYDRSIELIGSTYRGLARIRLAGESLRHEAAECLHSVSRQRRNVVGWMKGRFGR